MRSARARAVVLAAYFSAVSAAAQDAPHDSGVADTARCTVTADPGTVERERTTVTTLASDAMEGRAPGTAGGIAAADYIIQQITTAGVLPAGTDGYRQSFSMPYGRALTEVSHVVLRRGTDAMELRPHADYDIVAAGPDSRLSLPITWVGHGISAPAAHWDEYQGADLHNRAAMLLSDDPIALGEGVPRVPLSERIRAARAHGAIGVIVVDGLVSQAPRAIPLVSEHEAGWVVRLTRLQATWLLGGDPHALMPRTEAHAPQAVARTTVSVTVETHTQTVTTANVVGLVHGTSPSGGLHTNGVMVVGAHYDHVGHGGEGSRAPWSTEVHHGADDNASGSAVVLELAQRVAQRPLSHDVVFVWFGGEEEGLVGSRYFVAHRPPAALDIAAMLNFDMVGRLRNCRLYVEGTETSRALATLEDTANGPWGFDHRPWTESTPWGASDHMSFQEAHIPVAFFFTGLHADYHRPEDTADRVDDRGMAVVTGYGEAVLRALDTTPVTFTGR